MIRTIETFALGKLKFLILETLLDSTIYRHVYFATPLI
jgi:hypothetical protein